MTALRLAEGSPLGPSPSRADEGWEVAWPRPDGPWPVRLRPGASGEPRYGIYDPESGALRTVRPEEDDALPGLPPMLARGTLVAYRPGRRATVRIDGPSPAYAKVVRPRKTVAVARRARGVSAALAGRPGAPATPELLDVDLTLGIVVFAEAPGRPLHRSADAASVDRVASSLVAVHEVDAAGLGLPADEGVGLGRYVRLAADAFPERAPLLRATLQEVVALPRTGAEERRLLHGDLHDKNVVLGRGVTLLDVDMARPGDPAEDVGNLAAHLVLRSLQAGAGAGPGRAATRRLADAYREAGGAAPGPAVRRAAARTLVRLACLYGFRRRWRALVPAVAEEATVWARAWPGPPA
ncbi:MAG TPA: aminoglycoside phosphotransferase family protein [Actinomycetota bacterium]|nr:aminoglycoside phosphotransferase family protein [Actinomycetota bacterium]